MSVLRSQLVEQRVPEHLASRIASLEALHCALDLVEVARAARVRIGYAAKAYFDLGERIGLTWIKEQIESLAADGHWQGVARGTLRDNLYELQRKITAAVLACKGRDAGARVGHWIARHAAPLDALEAGRRRSAHRLAAGFCDSVGRSAGGQAPRAGLIECRWKPAISAATTCKAASSENSCWRGTSASSSSRRTMPPSCCARRSRPNANYKGTAFGGSLYSLAVLTGWAWVTRYLEARGLPADAVIQESSMRFLSPVQGELRASAAAPSGAQIDKFRKMLRRAGRGRIRLQVEINYGQTLATLFDGVFAAAMRR